MESNTIYLLDRPNRVLNIYHLPHLQVADCISESSRMNLNRSVVYDLILEKQAIPDLDIFRLASVNANIVIVSLRLAESIMRRRVEGIRLTPVEIK